MKLMNDPSPCFRSMSLSLLDVLATMKSRSASLRVDCRRGSFFLMDSIGDSRFLLSTVRETTSSNCCPRFNHVCAVYLGPDTGKPAYRVSHWEKCLDLQITLKERKGLQIRMAGFCSNLYDLVSYGAIQVPCNYGSKLKVCISLPALSALRAHSLPSLPSLLPSFSPPTCLLFPPFRTFEALTEGGRTQMKRQ